MMCVSQDALVALTLSEVVYRALDPGGVQEAECIAGDLCQSLPIADIQLKLQWSRPETSHRRASLLSVTKSRWYMFTAKPESQFLLVV